MKKIITTAIILATASAAADNCTFERAQAVEQLRQRVAYLEATRPNDGPCVGWTVCDDLEDELVEVELEGMRETLRRYRERCESE